MTLRSPTQRRLRAGALRLLAVAVPLLLAACSANVLPPAPPAGTPGGATSAPAAPAVTGTNGTGALGFEVRRLSWTPAAGAASQTVEWIGARLSGVPFGVTVVQGVTGASVDVRVPAWWAAADTLRVSACNSAGCTPGTPSPAAAPIPAALDLASPAGSQERLGATTLISQDGLTLVAAPGQGAPAAAMLRVFGRASSTAGWIRSDLPLPAGAASLPGAWGMALSADGGRLAIGDGDSGAGGRVSLVLNPGSPSPATVAINGAAGQVLGLSPSLSADGSRLAVVARDAGADAIRVYDLTGLGAPGWAAPAPLVVPVPAGLRVDAATRVALSGDGRALAITGRAAASQDAAYALVDLAGPLQATAATYASPLPSNLTLDGTAVVLSRDGSRMALASSHRDSAGATGRTQILPPLVCAAAAPRTCNLPSSPLLGLDVDTPGIAGSLALSPNGQVLAVGMPAVAYGRGVVWAWVASAALHSGWLKAWEALGDGAVSSGASVSIASDLSLVVGMPGAAGADGLLRFH